MQYRQNYKLQHSCHLRPAALIRLLLAVFAIGGAVGAFGIISMPSIVKAGCGCCTCCSRCIKTGVPPDEHSDTRDTINDHITERFQEHREDFILDYYWKKIVRPQLKRMTAQFTSTAYMQTAIIGSFFDATIQQESQLALQALQAEAVKDYAPSKAMCSMGTATRSLAASEAKSRANQIALSARGMQRQLGAANTIASGGPSTDKRYRANQFIKTYCATADNNNGLGQMCGSSGPAHKQNMDIDFIRTIAAPMTIKMDLTNDQLETSQNGADEEDVMALASNLYAQDVFEHISRAKLRVPRNQESYLELRSLAAKRNVAMNSYNAIAGMKASGSGASDKYLENIAKQLGVEGDEKLDKYLGENPSYYAQMEFLTKKLYQDPGFVADLVDRPANVKRQQAAMMSFELMQQRDIYKSMRRSEMLLSVLLELQLMKNQEQVEDSLRGITQTTGGG
jgi:hypothetical protein